MTIVRPTQRIDLHVHSKYAGRFKLFVLNSLEVEECYTEPEDLYQTMMARGMSMVTITDHDAIDGCLEIAHHGDHVFISEEVSARFPENGCIVHVLCYGITEAQHDELQRLRYNIYELVDYIRQEKILHSLAHPFSPVNQRLTPDLLKKSFLLFDTVEVINGQKDSGHERFMREVLAKVDQPVLERWSNEFDIAVAPDRQWRITAGSDDHSGHTMARSFVEFEGDPSFESLRRAIENRDVRVDGFEKTAKSYAHTAAIGTIQYFRHSSAQQTSNKPGVFHKLVDIIQNQDLPDDPAELPPALQRLVPAAMQTLAEMDSFPDFKKLMENGHKPETHDEIYSLVQSSLLRAFRSSTDAMKDAVESVDLEPLIDELPTLIRLTLLNLPYYFGIRFFYGERRRARGLYESLGLPKPLGQGNRVAILCDTLDNVDGLSINLRRLVNEMRDDGKEVFLCGAKPDGMEPSIDDEGIVRFPTIASFPLLGYEAYQLGWPSMLETVRWIDENEIDLIVATTPGPVGLIGMMAARLLDTPVIGQYHTNVPEYAFRIIGDRTIGRIVQAYTAWFYNQMEEVLAPTYATREVMAGNGIQSGKVTVVPRGVDSARFRPALARADFWTEHGLSGDKPTLVYVGRVSLEKNLPFLAKLFKHLVDEHGLDVQLGVVGEGPYLEKMKEELEGYPVAFTGYLKGDELSAAFASSDMMMFPSTTDTFGNVVLESMACGTPALVSDVGGPSEIVHHNETGVVLPAGNLRRWADAVVRLLSDGRLERMSTQARTYAESCTFEQARSKTWEFYSRHIETYRERVRNDAY